ncbi:restriction endonuclease subunit S [Pseudonocardia aurantiaca]|uniref:Restriction endonuclease subunit S n=1 Tax=Pseudonocardia aurantiaca TaxID=75290 RepID=A0ABW4FXQ9_9PSEU
MKTTNLENPVRLEWLLQQNLRLDARPYVGGAFDARDLLKLLTVPTDTLASLTTGHAGGLYNGPIFRRIFVNDRQHGVPFLGSADMLESDLSHLPLLRREDAESAKLAFLRVSPGTTFISCSGTVGRVVYARPDMVGSWSSQDTIKVVADPERIRPGYLFTVLASRFGTAILINSRSGTGIRHLEPAQVADLPIPRFGGDVEGRIHDLVEEAAVLRAAYQRKLVAATEDLFTSAGLPELIDLDWHARPRDLGFSVNAADAVTLRALNHSPRARWVADRIRSVPHRTLSDICSNGEISSGSRFTRVPAQPGHGSLLVGQRQGFWMRPEGRWISTRDSPDDVNAADETVLIARRGTLGESEVYCRSILVTGSWLQFAYTEDFLRVASGDSDVPGAYLFALFRSGAAFRLLRSLSSGGKQQDIHDVLRGDIPVPVCTPIDRERIAETVRSAHRDRDLADRREDEAFAALDAAVEGATR